MPDETGTETTRSDVPSAGDNLFGDAADDAADDEQNANEETAQDPQGSDDAEEQAVGDETEAPEDLKVVVSIKGGRATIGVQQPSSDPYIESFDDQDLSGLTQEVGDRTGESQVGRRTQVSGSRETRFPGQASGPAFAGVGAGRRRRGRGRPAATRDAEAVLRTGPCKARFGVTGRAAVRTGGGHLPSGATACIGFLHLCGRPTLRRRGRRDAAAALPQGQAHGRGAGQPEGQGRKAPARNRGPLRVGADPWSRNERPTRFV